MFFNKACYYVSLFICSVMLLLWSSDVHAMMLKMDKAELVEGSETIVIGSVESTDSFWNEERTMMYTKVSFNVDEDITNKANDQDSIFIIMEGGIIDAEDSRYGLDEMLYVSVAPTFEVGDKVGLFLTETKVSELADKGLESVLGVQKSGQYFRIYGNKQGVVSFGGDGLFYDESADHLGVNFKSADHLSVEEAFKKTVELLLEGKPLPEIKNNEDVGRSDVVESNTGDPSITSITPDISPAGTGNIITVRGSNFGDTRPENYNLSFYYCTERIFMIWPKYWYMPAQIVSWSDNEIRATLPTGNFGRPKAYKSYSVASGPAIISRAIDGTIQEIYDKVPFTVTYGINQGPGSYNKWKPSKWPGLSPTVKFKVNPGDDIARVFAVQAAAEEWNEVGADFKLAYDGTTTNDTRNIYNNVNEVLWVDNDPHFDGNTLGLSYTKHIGGVPVAMNIVLNDNFKWNTSGGCPSDHHDVQTVAAHEFGHAFGLFDLYGEYPDSDFPDDKEKIMYGKIGSGQTKRLHDHDKQGIKGLYHGEVAPVDPLFGVGLYSQKEGRCYIKDVTIPGPANRTFRYGPRNNDWMPVAGDWDGNGEYGIALYDQQGGRFFIKDDTEPGSADRAFRYGPINNDWLPVAGDWNGNGEYGIALYDQQGGRFFIKDDTEPGHADRTFRYGPSNNDWLPAAGDWDGNGEYGITLYDQQAGRFFIKDDTEPGHADRTFRYGPRNNDWLPVAGDWNRNGEFGIALYDQQDGRVYIKDDTQAGPADRDFRYGPRNNDWLPVAGVW